MNAKLDFVPNDWNTYATCYDALLQLKPYQNLLQHVADTLDLTPDDSLLDVGCGTGNLLYKIGAEYNHGALAGVDFSHEMLERARTKCNGYNPTFLRTDVNSPLPFGDGTFNKVVSVNVLYALTDPSATLKEIRRVLKPGGELVLATPKSGFDNGLILKDHAGSTEPDHVWEKPHVSAEREEFVIRKAITDEILIQQMLYVAKQNRSIAQTATFHFFTNSELEQLLQDSGFSVTKISPTYAAQGILVSAHK